MERFATDDKQTRLDFYSSNIDFDSINEGVLVNTLGGIIKTSSVARLVEMDSVENNNAISKIVAKTLMQVQNDGFNVDADSIDTALFVTKNIIENIDMDSVNSVRGGEIVASIVASNIYGILSDDLPFIGNISDLKKDGTKFKVYSVVNEVSTAVADFSDGDKLTSVNAGERLAYAIRDEEQAFVTGSLTHTFDLKVKTGSANYKMLKGANEVQIGADLFVNDYEVSSSETIAKRFAKIESTDATVVFDYAAGTIVVTFSADITNGTPIYFVGSLDTDKISEISGTIKTDIRDANYVAYPVAINTSVKQLDMRETLQATGINIKSSALTMAVQKVIEETKYNGIANVRRLATAFAGGLVDIASNSGVTTYDKFKIFDIALSSVRSDIAVSSQITNRVCLVGGRGLQEIVVGLDTVNNTATSVNSNSNGIRLIGYIKETPCYFDPTHDTKYPIVSGKHRIIVVGNPNEQAKKATIKGVGLPLIPEKMINDIDGNETIPFTGKLVSSINKDEYSRKLVRYIEVKI